MYIYSINLHLFLQLIYIYFNVTAREQGANAPPPLAAQMWAPF